MYGRTDADWHELVVAGRRFLEEQARLRQTTSYTEMNAVLARRAGVRAFDFDREDERAAMGHLLGLIVNETYPENGVLLSALVQYLNENDAGPGFYQLAKDKGFLPRGADATEKLAFWAGQVKAVHTHYGRGSPVKG
jgi:hypothetical protein